MIWGESRALAEDGMALTDGQNAFAQDLYGKLAGAGETNLFFSPSCIESALAMAGAGARGKTAEQMARVLHADPAAGTAPQAAGLWVANGLWAQSGFSFLPAFASGLETRFGAEMHEVDFANDSSGARKAINSWVAKETGSKITDLIAEGVLQPSTRLVLANAIYFKGKWATPFSRAATAPDLFYTQDKKVEVPFMHRTGKFAYYESDGMQILKIPYAEGNLAMVLFLPGEWSKEGHVAPEVTPANLKHWLNGLREQQVHVSLPRFTIAAQFDLKATLESMGMTDAFQDGQANFSGITGGRDLVIGDVVHKAAIQVNEEGTVAAAATGFTMRLLSIPDVPKLQYFSADHPFVFLIRDEKSGTILFMGRLAEPKGE